MLDDPRLSALPDIHGHAKGEHKPYADERPIPYSARMLFLWFYHAAKRRAPRFMMVSDHINYLTFEDPAAVNLVRRALRLALAGDLYGASETAGVDLPQVRVVSAALRSGMRFTVGAEVDNDPRSRPDVLNVVDAMKPDGIIRSIHFLPLNGPESTEEHLWAFDNPEFRSRFDEIGIETTWELYIETLATALATQPSHIVGHLYAPAKFGHWPDATKLDAYEDRILAICAEREIAVELNSRIFYRSDNSQLHHEHITAYRRLLEKAKQQRVPIAVGSDAHSPRDQGRGLEILLPLLDEAGINELAFPIAGRLARVALRIAPPPTSLVVTAASETIRQETPGSDTDPTPSAEQSPPTTVAKSRASRSSSKRVVVSPDTPPPETIEAPISTESKPAPKKRPVAKSSKASSAPVEVPNTSVVSVATKAPTKVKKSPEKKREAPATAPTTTKAVSKPKASRATTTATSTSAVPKTTKATKPKKRTTA